MSACVSANKILFAQSAERHSKKWAFHRGCQRISPAWSSSYAYISLLSSLDGQVRNLIKGSCGSADPPRFLPSAIMTSGGAMKQLINVIREEVEGRLQSMVDEKEDSSVRVIANGFPSSTTDVY